MIDTTTLLAAGYQQYPPSQIQDADACFQKIIRDAAGTFLYPIDITRYDYERHQLGEGVGWMAAMRFHLGGGQIDVFGDVSLTLGPNTTIAWVEKFLAKAHRQFRAIPDPYND